jgi:hypothetical protein
MNYVKPLIHRLSPSPCERRGGTDRGEVKTADVCTFIIL